MNIKVEVASSVGEPQASVNASQSITATPQEQSEDSYARHVTAMFLDTYGMTQKQLSELQPTLDILLRYRR